MATLTDAQEQELLDAAAEPEQTVTLGDQSITVRPAADMLLLLDRARNTRHREGGGGRISYFRLTGGYRSS